MNIERDFIERNERFSLKNKDFKALKDAQHPKLVVVACSDSRVAPEIILGAKLGELFVIRNAGGMAGEEALASIEYAVGHLGVKDILIMPHTGCGAVKAAQKLFLDGDAEGGDNLEEVVKGVYKNISGNKENRKDTTNAAIDNSRAEAKKIMKDKVVRSNGARAYIALYDIAEGKVRLLESF
jgi:carbonic anhydrase